jgi:hypothetical protein
MPQTFGVGTLIRRAETLVRAMLDVSANGQIRRLLTGWTLGIAGDALYLVIALAIAFDDGGAAAVGILGFVRMLPSTLVTLVVPLGRFHRLERIPVWVNVLRAAAAAATLALLLLDGPLLGVYAAAAVVASVGALNRPAMLAILPGLTRTPGELVSTNAASSVAEAIGLLLGPIIATLLLLVSPMAGAVAATVVFLAAALASATVRLADAARPHETQREAGAPLRYGLRTLRARRGAALIVLGFFAQTFVRGLLTTLAVVASFELLGLGDAGIGMLAAAMGAGGIAGAVAGFGLSGLSRLAAVFVASMLGWGIPIIVLGLAPSVPLALAGMAIIGVSNATLDIAGFTLLQRAVPSRSRPAVMAVLEATSGLGVAGGSIAAPVLSLTLGIAPALVVTGLILPVLGILMWPRLRSIDEEHVLPDALLRPLQANRLFALLPLDALERLAAAMTRVQFEPGAALMREGEIGDRYVVITRGAVSVVRSGREVAVLGPGDGVGEIALLRAVPRVATVTATEPVDGLAIERDEFIAVMTGHEGSHQTAHVVVDSRLAHNEASDAGADAPPGDRSPPDPSPATESVLD